jgi:uncharacterized integral membrane protein
MSILHRLRTGTTSSVGLDPTEGEPSTYGSSPGALSAAAPEVPSPDSPSTPGMRTPRTRTGMAWFGLCAAGAAFAVLIVFMMQNTRSTEISFFWFRGTLPLALALLIAGVGSALLTMVLGAARVTQLRSQARRHR